MFIHIFFLYMGGVERVMSGYKKYIKENTHTVPQKSINDTK